MLDKEEKVSSVAFVLLSYLIAWIAYGIIIACEAFGALEGNTGYIVKYALIGFVGACAPAYAVLILLLRKKYIRGIGGLFGRIHKTDGMINFFVATVLFFAVMVAQNYFLGKFSGKQWYECLIYLPIMLVGGGFEEVGWRGLLQPQLEKKLPFPIAATTVGIIWALWHTPLFFIHSSGQYGKNFFAFALLTVTLSFLFAALYKVTKCVFACMLLHAWNNSLGVIFTHDYYKGIPDVKTLIVFAAVIAASCAAWYIADKTERTKSEKALTC